MFLSYCEGSIYFLDLLCQSTTFLKWILYNFSSAPRLLPDTTCRDFLLVQL